MVSCGAGCHDVQTCTSPCDDRDERSVQRRGLAWRARLSSCRKSSNSSCLPSRITPMAVLRVEEGGRRGRAHAYRRRPRRHRCRRDPHRESRSPAARADVRLGRGAACRRVSPRSLATVASAPTWMARDCSSPRPTQGSRRPSTRRRSTPSRCRCGRASTAASVRSWPDRGVSSTTCSTRGACSAATSATRGENRDREHRHRAVHDHRGLRQGRRVPARPDGIDQRLL